jgi:hypothetical protein
MEMILMVPAGLTTNNMLAPEEVSLFLSDKRCGARLFLRDWPLHSASSRHIKPGLEEESLVNAMVAHLS